MKKCIHCGKELPQDAAWCPYCEKAQSKPESVRLPVRHRRKIFACIGALALLAIVLFVIFLRPHGSKIYEGEEQLNYKIDGQDCLVFLAFSNKSITTGRAQSEQVVSLAAGDMAAMPSQLFAYAENNPNFQEIFKKEIESCTVTTEPLNNGEQADVYGPAQVTDQTFAGAWKADIDYSAYIGTNRILWEVKMKNGDILRLSHKLTCNRIEVIEYHYEDTSMETVEEIQALIEKTAAESPEAVLRLFLPPVTYQEPLVMDKRTAILYGSEENGKKTTFTKTFEIKTREPVVAELYELEFQGNGGTGILASEALRAQACLFTGWDIGVHAREGSWVSLNNVAFVGNETGFCFDSKKSTFANPSYENIVFAENKVGMDIRNVPTQDQVTFINPIFDANETDYLDPNGFIRIEETSGQ